MDLFPDSVAAQIVETINNPQTRSENKGRLGLIKRAIHEPTSSKQVHQTDMIKDIS